MKDDIGEGHEKRGSIPSMGMKQLNMMCVEERCLDLCVWAMLLVAILFAVIFFPNRTSAAM